MASVLNILLRPRGPSSAQRLTGIESNVRHALPRVPSDQRKLWGPPNGVNAVNTETTLPAVREAAHTLGLQIQVVNASTIGEINAAFAALVRERADALFVNGDAFLGIRRVQLATLATRDRIPAAYSGGREFPAAGGLMSYGTNPIDAWRQVG